MSIAIAPQQDVVPVPNEENRDPVLQVLVPPKRQPLLDYIQAPPPQMYETYSHYRDHHHPHQNFFLANCNATVLRIWRIRNSLPDVVPNTSVIHYPNTSNFINQRLEQRGMTRIHPTRTQLYLTRTDTLNIPNRTQRPVVNQSQSICNTPNRRVVFPELKETDDSSQWCKICMTYETNTLILPCNHMVSCSDCVKHLQKCPVCRSRITEVKPIFKS